MTLGETHKADVHEKLGEYPDAGGGDDDGDDVENEPHDGQCEEETDEAQDTDREVPHAEAHDGRPEGEHDARKEDCDHGDTAEICRPLRALVEPRVVVIGVERGLYLRHGEHLG